MKFVVKTIVSNMDWFPEELLTPPIPLVALVGNSELHPKLSSYLSQYQSPISTISLSHVHQARVFSGKPKKPVDAKAPPPLGIFKADWVKKHKESSPAVIVLFLEKEKVYGTETEWEGVCHEIDEMK